MPIINRFDGGLVTGVDPVYLETNQATILLDANIESIGLKSAKEPVYFTEGARSFYQFPVLDSEPEEFHVTSSVNKRSYAEFQGRLLYSDGGPVCQSTDGEMVDDDFKWVTLGTPKVDGAIKARLITVEDDIPGADVTLITHTSSSGGYLSQAVIAYRVVDGAGVVYTHVVYNTSGYSTVRWVLPSTDYKIYREAIGHYGNPSDRFVLVSSGDLLFEDGLPGFEPPTDTIDEISNSSIPDYAGHRMSHLNGICYTSPYTVVITDAFVSIKVVDIMGVDIDGNWSVTPFNQTIRIDTVEANLVGIASTFIYKSEVYVHMALGHMSQIHKSDGTFVFESSQHIDPEFFKGTTVEHNDNLYMFNPRDGKVAIFDGSVIDIKDTEVFPYALAEDTVYTLRDDTIYAVINSRHESNIRTISLPSLAIGLVDKERIRTPLVRGLGGTSNSDFIDGDYQIFPVHGTAIKFSVKSNQVITDEVPVPTTSAYAVKGFAFTEQFAHNIVSLDDGKAMLNTWTRLPALRASIVYFDERTLTGTYVYTVAQKTPDGTSEGPIMDTESEPVTAYKGHIRVDVSAIQNTQALRLYRTGGYLTRFTMVEDIDLGGAGIVTHEGTDVTYDGVAVTNKDGANFPSVYVDKRDDVTIALGRNGKYDFADAPPEGLNYLTSHRGRLFGSVGSSLFWSEAGNANTWDELLSFVVMDREVTGLASCVNGLLIFMKGRINLLLGDARNSFSLRTVSVEKGTIDSYSIQEAANGAFFFSEDGLCFTDGAQIQELTYSILGPQKFDVIDSTATNRSYYALIKGYTNGIVDKFLHIIRYDFGKAPVFSTLNGDGIDGLGTIYGRLAHSAKEDIYDTLAGTARELNYKSGNITEGVPTMVKEWDRVRVAGRFIGTLVIRIEDKIVLSKDIVLYSDELLNYHIPKDRNKGKTISFEIVGRGFISSIEYSITARKTTK